MITRPRVLIGCERSGRVRDAFLRIGIEAWSCDLQPSLSLYSDNHIVGDVFEVLADSTWDLFICHPPCTYLSVVGNRHIYLPGRDELREKALDFFVGCYIANVRRRAIENPVGYVNTYLRRPDQIFHPYYFGDAQLKRTCLWLHNLPKLIYLSPLPPKPEPLYYLKTSGKAIYFTEGATRSANTRSQTFPSVARAMAEQWGRLLL